MTTSRQSSKLSNEKHFTSLIEAVLNHKMDNAAIQTHDSEGNELMIHIRSIASSEPSDIGLEELQSYFDSHEGRYLFIPCPIKKKIGKRTFDGGLLIYEEDDITHYIFYYIQFDLLYEEYRKNCKGDYQPFSVQLIYNELLKHLLYTCVPRLMQGDI